MGGVSGPEQVLRRASTLGMRCATGSKVTEYHLVASDYLDFAPLLLGTA